MTVLVVYASKHGREAALPKELVELQVTTRARGHRVFFGPQPSGREPESHVPS